MTVIVTMSIRNPGCALTWNERDLPIGSRDLPMRCCEGVPPNGEDVASFSPKNCTDDGPMLCAVSSPTTRSPIRRPPRWMGPQLKPGTLRSAVSFLTRAPGTSMTKNAPIWLMTTTLPLADATGVTRNPM